MNEYEFKEFLIKIVVVKLRLESLITQTKKVENLK